MKKIANGRLAEELAGLPHLDRQALKEKWRTLYGSKPPRLGRDLLVRAVAYRIQENALGGLDPKVRRILDTVAKDVSRGRDASVPASLRIKPGTRLLRQWQGRTHEVIVLNDGAMFEGRRYRSLSDVARAITGAHWSGPRFFGLKSAPVKPSS